MVEEVNGGWWSRLKQGLKRSSDRLGDGLKTIFVRHKLNQQTLEELEDLLIMSDLGVETATRLTKELARQHLDQDITLQEVKAFLADAITQVLEPVAHPLSLDPSHKPYVILVVGVNGSGKTTTIGKLAKFWQDQGRSVMMAAGDTFRAAAVEQLQVWGRRLEVPVIAGKAGADAAGLAYDALIQAQEASSDILLIDTAGRLQNKAHLMEELKKIQRVLAKVDESAPHATLLVLDGTTGQNAHSQVETFQKIVGLTGLIVTKLDGTAKGGVIVSLAQKFKLPIHAIGVGEMVDDLRPFTSNNFAKSLVGLEKETEEELF